MEDAEDIQRVDLGDLGQIGGVTPKTRLEECMCGSSGDASGEEIYDLTDVKLDRADVQFVQLGLRTTREEIEARESNVAMWLALGFFGLFAAVIILTIVLACAMPDAPVTAVTDRFLPALTAIAGLIFGYYFSEKRLRT